MISFSICMLYFLRPFISTHTVALSGKILQNSAFSDSSSMPSDFAIRANSQRKLQYLFSFIYTTFMSTILNNIKKRCYSMSPEHKVNIIVEEGAVLVIGFSHYLQRGTFMGINTHNILRLHHPHIALVYSRRLNPQNLIFRNFFFFF